MKKMTNIVPFFKMSGIRSKKSAIVNPDKFLTRTSNPKSSLIKSKKSAIVKQNKSLIPKSKSSSAIIKYSEKSLQTLEDVDILKQIQKKVIKIDKLLKNSLLMVKKDTEKKRVTKEQTEFDKKENELEKKKPKTIPGINLPSLPKVGIFDWIKNFITQTILGFIFVRLIDHLPKLLKLMSIIFKASEFIIDVGGKLLDGLVTFIDWGYKAYDATKGFVKNIFGEGGAKQFDNLMGVLNQLSNVIILASLAAAMPGGPGGGRGGRGGGGPGGGRGGRGGRYGLTETREARRGVSRVDTTGGINYRNHRTTGTIQASSSKLADARIERLNQAGRLTFDGKSVTDISYQRRKGYSDVMKKYADKFGRDAAVRRFGQESVEGLGGKYARSGITNLARKGLVGLAGKGGAKAVLGAVRPLLKRLPIIGGLLDFGLSVALGEDPGRAAFRAIGATLVAAVGSAIGSLAFGAGAIIGGIIGGIGGDMLGGALYDMFFRNKTPKQAKGKIVKAVGGGKPTTRGGKLVGGPAKRTIKKRKKSRTVSFTPRKIIPGSSIGGEKKIESVFPNPKKEWWDPLGVFTGSGNKQQEQQSKPKNLNDKAPNSQEFLVESNEVLGKSDYFGPFFTLAIKSVLGQKPDKLDYKNVGRGLNSWMQTTFKSNTLGFAGGGEVDASEFFKGEDYADVIAKTVEESVSKEVDTTIRNLSKELSLKRPVGRDEMLQENIKRNEKDPNLDVGPGGSGETITGGNADFWTLVAISRMEDSDPQGSADVAQSIYNRVASGIYGGKTIKGIVLRQGQYEPTWKYPRRGKTGIPNPEWNVIKDLTTASAATGISQSDLQRTAAALRNSKYQEEARKFVGGRTDFMGGGNRKGAEDVQRTTNKPNNFFGWFVGPAAIAYGKKNPGPARAPALGDIVVMGGGAGGSLGGSGQFIQGNSGNSRGVHFHIGPGSQVRGSILQRQYFGDARATAKQAINYFLSKGSRIYDGRRGKYYTSGNEVDAAQQAHTAGGSAGGIDMQVDFEKPVPFPLKTTGMAYRPNGFGVSADILGSNSFVAHGRYDEKGKKAPQTGGLIAYAKGGETKDGPHVAMLADGKGSKAGSEYVIDADTTKTIKKFAPGLLDIFNYKINNKSSLIKHAPLIIEQLKSISGYDTYRDTSKKIKDIPAERRTPTSSELRDAQSARKLALTLGKSKPEAEKVAVQAGINRATKLMGGPEGPGKIDTSSIQRDLLKVNKLLTPTNEKLKTISEYTDYEKSYGSGEGQIVYLPGPVEYIPVPMGSKEGSNFGRSVIDNTVPGMETLNAVG